MKNDLTITATWPVRTEMATRPIGRSSNALASSLVLVCRKRFKRSNLRLTEAEFSSELESLFPAHIESLQAFCIAPVDLSQSCIGPVMTTFSKYKTIRKRSGEKMKVRDALLRIREILGKVLTEQSSAYDSVTRIALALLKKTGIQSRKLRDRRADCFC